MAGFARFHRLSRLDELAWRTRIEGSLGIPEREFNGPVVGLQERYREGLAELGADFCDVDGPRTRTTGCGPTGFPGLLRALLRGHVRRARSTAATATASGWEAIEFPGDVQPRGCSDAEVAGP